MDKYYSLDFWLITLIEPAWCERIIILHGEYVATITD
jgi:hypothetical protein